MNDVMLGVIIGVILDIYPLYMIVFGVNSGCANPLRIWKGIISDEEFDRILVYIFESGNEIKYDGYDLKCGPYTVWCKNSYFGFSINGLKGFSYFQMRKFYKKLINYILSLKKKTI